MRHLTRDFLTMASASCPGTNMYALAIFLVVCGGYTIQGQTNFDLSSGSLELAHGISASINTVGGPTDVFLPSGSHVVGASDVGRILCLKSRQFTRANSGLFRVTGFNSGSNTLTVNYRASSSIAPPPEQYMSWGLYANELSAALQFQSGTNGTPRYGSWNASHFATSSASRVMLRSPDVTSWQVRMCLESSHDVSGSCPSGFSIAPGYGGNGDGDFFAIPHGEGPGHDEQLHLHTALFYDTTSSLYRGMVVGLTPQLNQSGSGPLWSRGQWRISMMVDDVSGTAAIVNHNVSLPATVNSGSGWAVFGQTEDESEVPGQGNLSDPSINVQRLFVVGSSNPQSALTWKSQFHVDNNMQVVGFGKRGYPVPGVLSCYSDVSNPGNTHVRYLTSSVDSPWVNATEVLDVEVLLGTVDQTLSAATSQTIFPLQPRRLGRLPMFRQGRANYPNWTVTSDGGYYHLTDGIFLRWGGPATVDTVSGTASFGISGSIELQEGMMQFGAFLSGADPFVPAPGPNVNDIDATRYRKTYSIYRQVPVNVGVVKGGSNPAKP